MIEQPISPEDEARFMQIMAGYDEAMREHFTGPAPMCHFTPMEFHDADAGDGSGYLCVHCGHTEDADDAWAKVEARKHMTDAVNARLLIAAFFALAVAAVIEAAYGAIGQPVELAPVAVIGLICAMFVVWAIRRR